MRILTARWPGLALAGPGLAFRHLYKPWLLLASIGHGAKGPSSLPPPLFSQCEAHGRLSTLAVRKMRVFIPYPLIMFWSGQKFSFWQIFWPRSSQRWPLLIPLHVGHVGFWSKMCSLNKSWDYIAPSFIHSLHVTCDVSLECWLELSS